MLITFLQILSFGLGHVYVFLPSQDISDMIKHKFLLSSESLTRYSDSIRRNADQLIDIFVKPVHRSNSSIGYTYFISSSVDVLNSIRKKILVQLILLVLFSKYNIFNTQMDLLKGVQQSNNPSFALQYTVKISGLKFWSQSDLRLNKIFIVFQRRMHYIVYELRKFSRFPYVYLYTSSILALRAGCIIFG